MQQYKKILGKVMMTAEGTYDSNKEYDPISLITDEETGKSYISRKEVPAGTQINNREYWQPVASSGIIDNGVIILNRKNSDGQVPIYDLKSAAEAVAIGDRKGGVILGFLGFNPETDTVPTWKLYQYNDVSPSNWNNIDYWLPMDYTNKYAGWFDNEKALYDNVPFPKVGMYAYVGNSVSSAVVYRCYNDRIWQPTEDKAFSGVVNLADEEDITSKQNKLKFKDKEYNPAQYNGMGRIYLRKNMIDGKNVLTQKMIEATNTIYIIQYDYDLQGDEITIPEGCTLDFQGGSFSNGTIVGNITAIQASLTKIFGLDVELIGTWNVTEACPEWFGAVGDGVNDDSSAIQVCLNSFSVVHFCEKTYCVNTTLNTGIAYLIKGSSDRYGKSIIKNKAVVLFNLNTATGKPYQNYVTFRNIALINDNISSGYEYGIDTICIKNSVENPVSVTLENVLIEKFEKGLHNDMPVYYNQIINTRFDTVRFCLSDIHINNLNIDKVRAQTFEDFITIYGGDGPCNIINSTFEKFCGCIAKSGYSTDYTPQINFSNNYIEIYGEVSIPNGFTDRNNGHFGGNTLFEGCFSIINLNGNNFQINDALYLVDSQRVYQLISTGNFFFLVKSDSKLNKLFKISSIDVLTTKDLYIEIINPKTSYSGHSIDGSTFVLNNYYGFDGFDVITGSQYSHYIGLPTLLVGYEAGISGTHYIRHWSDGKNICFKGTVSRTDSSKTDIIDLSSYHIVSDIDIYFNTFDKNNNLVVLKYNHTSKHIEFVSNAGTLEEFYFDGIKIPLITYV